MTKILALSLILAGACAASTPKTAPAAPAATAQAPTKGLTIGLTTVYVDDQDKALRFYTEVLGFTKKDDFTNGDFRWLTVTAAGGGTELQLARNDTPAAKAFQEALFQQSQPAIMFYTGDLAGEYERIKARGATFTMPPTDVTMANIAMLEDTCGNLIQLTELAR